MQAVAQPTLEQVFVRTVLQFSEGERPGGAARQKDRIAAEALPEWSSPEGGSGVRGNRSASAFDSATAGANPLSRLSSGGGGGGVNGVSRANAGVGGGFHSGGGGDGAVGATERHPDQSPWVRSSIGSLGEGYSEGLGEGGGDALGASALAGAAAVRRVARRQSSSSNSNAQGGGDGGDGGGSGVALRPSSSSFISSLTASSRTNGSGADKHIRNSSGNNNDDDDDVGSSNRISVSDPAAMVQYDYDTGVTTEWLGLNRRSHRFLGIAAGLFMFVSYFFMSAGRIGYIFFPFIIHFIIDINHHI